VRASVFAITAAGGASVVLRAIARWHCECACANPRGAYAPRSWLHARISSEMRGCDLQRRFVSHGGLTAPALVLRCERLPAKNDFCDAQTHIHKSGGREPAVGVGKRTCNTDTAHVRGHSSRAETRAAGVSPPWVWVTHLQHRYRSRPGTLVTCGDKSGGRQPAVGVGNAFATALPLTHGRLPRVRVPITGAFASRENTGG